MKHDWKYKRLGDVLLFDKRFNGLPQGEQEKVVKFSHVSAEKLKELYVENGDVRLISTGNYDGTTTIENAGENLSKGEIITIPTGGVANIKYYNGYFVDSGNIITVSSDPTNWMRYIFYAMIANKDTINSFYRGVSIKHPYMPDIYNITIPVPPLPIQKQIVSLLDKLNRVIEAKKEQIAELDNLAQAIFYDMFGDPISNPKGWEMKKWESFGTIINGYAFNSTQFVEKGVPVLKIGNINTGLLKLENVSYYQYSDKLQRYEVHPNDVVLSLTGTAGKDDYGNVCIIPNVGVQTFYLNQRNAKLESKGMINNQVLKYIFACPSFKKELTKNTNGVRQGNILNNDIENLYLPIPPKSIQQSFANKIGAIERQKELINQSIKDVQTLFDAKMDYYFGD